VSGARLIPRFITKIHIRTCLQRSTRKSLPGYDETFAPMAADRSHHGAPHDLFRLARNIFASYSLSLDAGSCPIETHPVY
jgi:hypothetical protein